VRQSVPALVLLLLSIPFHGGDKRHHADSQPVVDYDVQDCDDGDEPSRNVYGAASRSSHVEPVAYMSVIIIEPLADLGVLAAAKALRTMSNGRLFSARLRHAA
jgi:hypothetical protein